jgi:hypothetical protein
MTKKPADELTDEEAEARATDALRRALTTPYKAQRELKVGKRKKKRTVKKK